MSTKFTRAVVNEEINLARYADLKIGVVPVINLSGYKKYIEIQTQEATVLKP